MRRAVLAAALAALALPAPAAAAPGLEVGMEDERLLLDRPDEGAEAVVQWALAGVDVVRIHARWWEIGPARRGEAHDWSRLDRAVDMVRGAGMRVMLSVTGPGPRWTGRRPGRPEYRPAARAFGRFAGAVAARYRDAVDRYLVWNEPNIPGWLSPQRSCGPRRCRTVAPHLYRRLVHAAGPAIRRSDPGAEVVIGELAPIGSPATREDAGVAPLPFLRALACVDRRYRPVRTGPCRRFRPVQADALGHHPHGVRTAPGRSSRPRGWAKMGDTDRLLRVVDRLTRMGRLVPSGARFPVLFTEFGYQTSPPDHVTGIPVGRQARWNQEAAYLAWRHPRVRALVHYQWRDEPVRWRARGPLSYAGWQSGLLFVDGTAKPALEAFFAPFVVDRKRGRFWGQVRPGNAHEVRLLARKGGRFEPVATTRTDARGYWTLAKRPRRRTEYRFEWGRSGRSRSVVAR